MTTCDITVLSKDLLRSLHSISVIDFIAKTFHQVRLSQEYLGKGEAIRSKTKLHRGKLHH